MEHVAWQISLGPGRLSGGVVGGWLGPMWRGLPFCWGLWRLSRGLPFCWNQSVEVKLKCAVAQYAMAIEHHQGVWDVFGWVVFH